MKQFTAWQRALQSVWQVLLAAMICGFGSNSGQSSPSSPRMLKITTCEEGGMTHFYVQNLEAADVTATFNMQLTNLKGSTNFPYTATYEGHKTVEAFTLTPIVRGAGWDFSYTDAFTIGSVTAVHDDSYLYSLPYAPGKSFFVTQGYHGSFSHSGPDEYAIDWKMPVGTPVYAARDGMVVKSKDDSNSGGPDRKYESYANCILIEHSDGTIGIYAHLMKKGNVVKVGDKVSAGQLIGHSGNTGFTSGPHLHFSVFKTRSGKERLSLPVRFRTDGSEGITIVSGESYRAGRIETLPVNVNTTVAKATLIKSAEQKANPSGKATPERPISTTESAGGWPSGSAPGTQDR